MSQIDILNSSLKQSIKGKTVFMVLYNYADCDYSVIKTMENLNDAIKYIIIQESHLFDCDLTNNAYIEDNYVLVEITNMKDIKNKYVDNKINICYVVSGKYTFNISYYAGYSSYIIVPIVIE